MKQSCILFLLLCSFPIVLHGQSSAQKPCEISEEFRQFDFWIGEWTVEDSTGTKLGDSSVQSILDGCVVFENWENPGAGYSGKSLNYYNAAIGMWEQKWIDNQGAPIEFKGTYDSAEKTLKFSGSGFQGGNTVKYRLNFHEIKDDYVRQQFFAFDPSREVWVLIFDGHYRRKK
ncbi:MAG: DUF1579 family protein [Bacteroidota bacterium]